MGVGRGIEPATVFAGRAGDAPTNEATWRGARGIFILEKTCTCCGYTCHGVVRPAATIYSVYKFMSNAVRAV